MLRQPAQPARRPAPGTGPAGPAPPSDGPTTDASGWTTLRAVLGRRAWTRPPTALGVHRNTVAYRVRPASSARPAGSSPIPTSGLPSRSPLRIVQKEQTSTAKRRLVWTRSRRYAVSRASARRILCRTHKDRHRRSVARPSTRRTGRTRRRRHVGGRDHVAGDREDRGREGERDPVRPAPVHRHHRPRQGGDDPDPPARGLGPPRHLVRRLLDRGLHPDRRERPVPHARHGARSPRSRGEGEARAARPGSSATSSRRAASRSSATPRFVLRRQVERARSSATS